MRHTHAVLRLALKDAVAAGKLPANQAAGAKLPRDQGEAREMQTWTAEQLALFLEVTADDRLAELWHVAALSGLRRGELCGLRWSDATLPAGEGEPGLLRIRRSLVSVGGRPQVSTPKTESGGREVAIDPTTVEALKRQAARQLVDHDHWKEA